MLKKRFYGKGLAPSWYPADLKWEKFSKVSNKGTQEQKTKICEAKCLKAKCLKRSVTPENKGEGGLGQSISLRHFFTKKINYIW